MTILDFRDHIAESTLKKGLDYFHKNKVSQLDEINEHWDAYVQGREEYLVNISLQGKFITHTSCDCRVFNHEDHCKHVVAVICNINDRLFHPTETESTVTPYTLSLLNSLPAEDLRLFVLNSMHEDEYLTKDLVAFAEATTDNAAVVKHINVINAAFSRVANIEDHDSGEPGTLAVKPAAKLLIQAKRFYQEGDVTAAMDIALAVLSKKHAFDSCQEDESGAYEYVVADAFNLLDEMCSNTELNEYNTRRIMRHSWEALWSKQIEISPYEVHWLDLLLRHGWDEEKKDSLLKILEGLIEDAKKEKANVSYKRFTDAKQAILNGTHQVKKVIKSTAEVPISADQALKTLPPRPISKAPAPKDAKKAPPLSEKKLAYLKTKAALLTELETEKATGTKIKYHALQKELITIMHQNSDIFGVREMGNRFYEETGDAFFYESVKNTYMLTEWEKLIATKKG